jgi:hypothetical protein
MKHIIVLITTLFLVANTVVAQKNITITGTAANAEGKVVELYRYADKISQSEVLLDRQRIGEDHSFTLRCYTNYPMLVFMQVENYSQSFYVEPGRDYKVAIPQFDWNIDEQKNVFLDPVTLPLQFMDLPKDDINLLVGRLDGVVSQYLLGHRAAFDQRYRPRKQYFDSLVLVVNRLCPDVEGCPFFNRYKEYTLAQMKLDMRMCSRKSVFNRYIKEHPVLCYDENYMSLFTSLYGNTVSKGSRYVSVHRLASWIDNLDLRTFIDSLGVDPLLRHEQVRELAALLALKEARYNFHYYNPKKVERMVEMIGEQSKFNDHKVIARNLLESFNDVKEGYKVQPFELPDVEKRMVSLDSMRGMWVYLSFVRVDDPNSIGEIETMAHFKDTVYSMSDSIEFVTIACDREFQKMYHFLMNSKHGDRYSWTWLHFNGNFDLLRQFGVCSYPWFVLIDPQGKVYYDVTPAPSTGIMLNPPWMPKQQVNEKRSLLFQE